MCCCEKGAAIDLVEIYVGSRKEKEAEGDDRVDLARGRSTMNCAAGKQRRERSRKGRNTPREYATKAISLGWRWLLLMSMSSSSSLLLLERGRENKSWGKYLLGAKSVVAAKNGQARAALAIFKLQGTSS